MNLTPREQVLSDLDYIKHNLNIAIGRNDSELADMWFDSLINHINDYGHIVDIYNIQQVRLNKTISDYLDNRIANWI